MKFYIKTSDPQWNISHRLSQPDENYKEAALQILIAKRSRCFLETRAHNAAFIHLLRYNTCFIWDSEQPIECQTKHLIKL